MLENSIPANGYTLAKPDVAIILAGGLGTRLRQVVADRPKVLATAGGRPFLDYLLAYLAGQDIRRVILSAGYLAEQVQLFAGNGSPWGLTIDYVIETQPLGTGGALKLAIQGLQSAVFTLNGDTLFEINLAELWRCHRQKQAVATIALRLTPSDAGDHKQRGCISVDANGFIVDFTEKPDTIDVSSVRPAVGGNLLTNGGIYVLTPAALISIEPGQSASLEQEVFPKLVASRMLAGCPQNGYFIDIGTPENLARFERDIASKKIKTHGINPNK